MELAEVLLMIAVVFALAKVAAFIFNKFGIPGLVGEILVGVLLACIVINGQSIAEYLGLFKTVDGQRVTTDMFDILDVIANIGVMFLLFSVGLETKVSELLKVGKAAFLVALLGVIVPFILGYVYVSAIYGGDMNQALFLGAAMVATSVGITARVIKDMKLTDAKESKIIIGAAVIDDVLGMIVLAIVKGMNDSSGSGSIDIGSIVLITVEAFAFVIIIMLLAYFAVPRFYNWRQDRVKQKKAENSNYKENKYDMFVVSIIFMLLLAWFAENMGLAAIIGAFLAGMLFADYAEKWGLHHQTEAVTSFLVSFFFVYVGLQVNLSGVGVDLLIAVVVVIVLAMIGKYVGCALGAKIGDKTLDKQSLNIIGIGMIPRGEVGIIVATIGLQLLGPSFNDLFTVVVLMSVITTIVAPPLLSIFFKKKYGGTKAELKQDSFGEV